MSTGAKKQTMSPTKIGGILATLAAIIAGYLAFLSMREGFNPPGCGSGSGCAEVIGSKWSKVFSLPVALPAAGLYLYLAWILWFKPALSGMKTLLAGMILGGALWFVMVQLFIIKAICPWCMADHCLGVIAALIALKTGKISLKVLPLGFALPFIMAFLQVMQPEMVHQLDLPTDRNVDRVIEGKRYVTLMDGAFQFEVAAEAHLGNPDAERVMLIAVDYACPHCRKLHAMAKEEIEKHAGNFCVIVLPTPIHPSCNSAMTQVSDRFENSCEIALLSLAVFKIRPEEWVAFDEWLFEDEMPRSISTVSEFALNILGNDLAKAKKMAQVDMQRNIDLFAAMPLEPGSVRRVPVSWWVNEPPIVGPVYNPEMLWNYAMPKTQTIDETL